MARNDHFDRKLGSLLHQIPCAHCGKPIGPEPYRAHNNKQYHSECAELVLRALMKKDDDIFQSKRNMYEIGSGPSNVYIKKPETDVKKASS